MKVAIELDLTPQEARELLGMPDISALQEKWTAAIAEQIMADVQNLSPDAITQSWMKAAGANTEWLGRMMNFPGLDLGKNK